MTTLKEYKAIMDGATDAPWRVYDKVCYTDNTRLLGVGIKLGSDICEVHAEDVVSTRKAEECLSNAQFIAASRNIAPELIRVIELAEEALKVGLKIRGDVHPNNYEILIQALSEIRKLRG